MTVYFAYERLDCSSEGEFFVGPADPGSEFPQNRYTWNYWIPALAASSEGRLRLERLDQVVRDRRRFVYPVELLWWWIEETAGRPPRDFLHLPTAVLEGAWRGRAVILLFFGHEARVREPQVNQLLKDWMAAYDLPPDSVWFIDGNVAGGAAWDAWVAEANGGRSPFRHSCCEVPSVFARHLLRLLDRGQTLRTLWGAGGTDERPTRNVTRVRLLEAPYAAGEYPNPRSLRAELASGALRPKRYLCMNRYPRSHRRWLVTHLAATGTLSDGLVSLRDDASFDEPMEDARLEAAWQRLRPQLPLEIDRPHPSPTSRAYWEENFSALALGDPAPYWTTYFNIVADTTMDDGICFVTEKVFKPIATCQPFVVAGTLGALEYLQSLGFRTFGAALDESYDRVPGGPARMGSILKTVDQITGLSPGEARDRLCALEPVLSENFALLRVVRTPMDDIFDTLAAWTQAA